jgi:hypothetical protein
MRHIMFLLLFGIGPILLAQPSSADLESLGGRLADLMHLDSTQHLIVATSDTSAEATSLVFAAIEGDRSEPATVLVLERIEHDGREEFLRVDQRPDLPDLQPIELRDQAGRPLSCPTAIGVQQHPDGSLWLRVSCAASGELRAAAPEEVTVRVRTPSSP